MTRKERAIANLKQMCSDGRYLGSGSYAPLEVLEDFSTAIKALEQEPILDKLRAEIAEYGSIMVAYAITKDTKTEKGIEKLVSDILKEAKEQVLDIIDKYKTDSEVEDGNDDCN